MVTIQQAQLPSRLLRFCLASHVILDTSGRSVFTLVVFWGADPSVGFLSHRVQLHSIRAGRRGPSVPCPLPWHPSALLCGSSQLTSSLNLCPMQAAPSFVNEPCRACLGARAWPQHLFSRQLRCFSATHTSKLPCPSGHTSLLSRRRACCHQGRPLGSCEPLQSCLCLKGQCSQNTATSSSPGCALLLSHRM